MRMLENIFSINVCLDCSMPSQPGDHTDEHVHTYLRYRCHRRVDALPCSKALQQSRISYASIRVKTPNLDASSAKTHADPQKRCVDDLLAHFHVGAWRNAVLRYIMGNLLSIRLSPKATIWHRISNKLLDFRILSLTSKA